MSAYTHQKANSKYINRTRLERASQMHSSDSHKTPYDRVKRCRERKINIKASERVNSTRQWAIDRSIETPCDNGCERYKIAMSSIYVSDSDKWLLFARGRCHCNCLSIENYTRSSCTCATHAEVIRTCTVIFGLECQRLWFKDVALPWQGFSALIITRCLLTNTFSSVERRRPRRTLLLTAPSQWPPRFSEHTLKEVCIYGSVCCTGTILDPYKRMATALLRLDAIRFISSGISSCLCAKPSFTRNLISERTRHLDLLSLQFLHRRGLLPLSKSLVLNCGCLFPRIRPPVVQSIVGAPPFQGAGGYGFELQDRLYLVERRSDTPILDFPWRLVERGKTMRPALYWPISARCLDIHVPDRWPAEGRHDGNIARLARRSDEALEVRVSVELKLLDHIVVALNKRPRSEVAVFADRSEVTLMRRNSEHKKRAQLYEQLSAALNLAIPILKIPRQFEWDMETRSASFAPFLSESHNPFLPPPDARRARQPHAPACTTSCITSRRTDPRAVLHAALGAACRSDGLPLYHTQASPQRASERASGLVRGYSMLVQVGAVGRLRADQNFGNDNTDEYQT
ncbi:hypothetical protein PR048_004374 [Dryococelus australis]|uniref:Uncharacterized protein n=1 Tax=Dryococelus australis TaxID=614101 RepID=A0ABQ9I6A8_9NEOP|nr:hypothetical protein PR048_004374 [Dryococelus australis]